MLQIKFLMNFFTQKYSTYSPVILYTSRQMSRQLIQDFPDIWLLWFHDKKNPKCDVHKNTITFPILKYFFQTEIIPLEPCWFTYIQKNIQTVHTKIFRQLRFIFPIEKLIQSWNQKRSSRHMHWLKSELQMTHKYCHTSTTQLMVKKQSQCIYN